MQINKAALEIFDFTSSLAVYSEHELKVGDQAIQDYIANHVAKAFKDPGARTGTLHDASPFGKQLVEYKKGDLKFIDLSKDVYKRQLQNSCRLVLMQIKCPIQGPLVMYMHKVM